MLIPERHHLVFVALSPSQYEALSFALRSSGGLAALVGLDLELPFEALPCQGEEAALTLVLEEALSELELRVKLLRVSELLSRVAL